MKPYKSRIDFPRMVALINHMVPVLRFLALNPDATVTHKQIATYLGMLDETGGEWNAKVRTEVREVMNIAAAVDRACKGGNFSEMWNRVVVEATMEAGSGVSRVHEIVEVDAGVPKRAITKPRPRQSRLKLGASDN